MSMLTISLSDDQREYVKSVVAAGKYASPSDFIAALVCEAQLLESQDQFESLILEAENETAELISGPPKFWAKMHANLEEFISTEGLK